MKKNFSPKNGVTYATPKTYSFNNHLHLSHPTILSIRINIALSFPDAFDNALFIHGGNVLIAALKSDRHGLGVLRLKDMLEEERPVVFPEESIALIRTVRTVPEIFTPGESEQIYADHYKHEQGKVCNISPAYHLLLESGFANMREQVRAAKAHPERHRNLIVRVWGWSGYFAELDECYQNHIIKRMELAV